MDNDCPTAIFCFLSLFFFFLPHFDTLLHIAVISIFISGPQIFFLKITSNFMLLERPLSLKQIFHYYTQFK